MLALSLVSFALVTPSQPPKPADPGFGNPAETEFHWPVYVLKSPDVQKELKITKEQLAKFDALPAQISKKLEPAFALPPARFAAHAKTVGAWADRAVADILTADQRPRHRQILWQVLEFNGGVVGMAANPVFAREVGLTAEQVKKTGQFLAEYNKVWEKWWRDKPGGNAVPAGVEKLYAEANEKALKLLTADQKKKWNEVLGEAFKGDVIPLPIPGQPPKKFVAPAPKT